MADQFGEFGEEQARLPTGLLLGCYSFSGWYGCGGACSGDQFFNLVSRLSANANPVVNTGKVQTQAFSRTSGNGIKEAEAFNKTPVTLRRSICNGDVVERVLLGARTG